MAHQVIMLHVFLLAQICLRLVLRYNNRACIVHKELHGFMRGVEAHGFEQSSQPLSLLESMSSGDIFRHTRAKSHHALFV